MDSFLEDLISILDLLVNLVNNVAQIKDFVKLICWDGENKLQRWDVLDEGGAPISIKETMHQIAVTKDYIILMDTVFKVGAEELFTSILPTKTEYPNWFNQEINKLNEKLREFLDVKQSDDTFIYVINKKELNANHPTVTAKKFTIPLSAAHFQADYDNVDNKITLHMAHNNAWDASDWIRPYDQQKDPPQIKTNLPIGMPPDGIDINCLGKHIINMTTEKVESPSEFLSDDQYTWMTAITTYNSINGITLPNQLKNLYWISWGAWPDLLTDHIFELYKNSRTHQIDVNDIPEISQQGKPVNLIRLDTNKMTREDVYSFPTNVFANSPQFIPRQPIENSSNVDESMNGYIICVVNIGNDDTQATEFWIFDAANLSNGPLCKLVSPNNNQLKLGMTIHSTWLPKIGKHQAKYNIPVKTDYDSLIQNQNPIIVQLFEQEVYPHFP